MLDIYDYVSGGAEPCRIFRECMSLYIRWHEAPRDFITRIRGAKRHGKLQDTSPVSAIFAYSKLTILTGRPCRNTTGKECVFDMHTAKTPSTPYRLRVPASHPRLAQPATALSCGAHGTMPKHMVFIRFILPPQVVMRIFVL